MKIRRSLILAAALLGLVACGGNEPTPNNAPAGDPALNKPAAGGLEWAVGGDWRLPAVKARDAHRHPVETLTFFGLKSSDTVVELWPGGGYYTAILGPWLKSGGGRLIAAQTDSPQAVANWRTVFADHPETYGDIVVTTASRTAPNIADDGTADAVVTFRNIHNWMMAGYADKIFADAFRALKPGGVLGVEEHRLPSARDQDLKAGSGYVSEAYVTQLAERAGFVLEETSEINANPKDTADHPLGVWMLPPTFRAPAPDSEQAAGYDRARYEAIGESDRMTLRFRKPAAAALTTPPAQ